MVVYKLQNNFQRPRQFKDRKGRLARVGSYCLVMRCTRQMCIALALRWGAFPEGVGRIIPISGRNIRLGRKMPLRMSGEKAYGILRYKMNCLLGGDINLWTSQDPQ